MRIPGRCPQCPEPKGYYLLDLADDGAYIGECDKGHAIQFALQNLRYEVLYESGIVAMLSGFHREAVTSFAAAMERFFEFGIYALLEHGSVPFEEVQAAWKDLATATERQLGAFLVLYVSAFKRRFQPPEGSRSLQKLSQFRNDIVHKGYIPTRPEAEKYAEEVFRIVWAVRTELLDLDAAAIDRTEIRTGLHVAHEALKKRAPGPPLEKDGLYWGRVTTQWSMMLTRGTGGPIDFASRLEKAKFMASKWGLPHLREAKDTSDAGDRDASPPSEDPGPAAE